MPHHSRDRRTSLTFTTCEKTKVEQSGYWKNEKSLQLRLCVIGYTSSAGHRGCDATELVLQQFVWKTLYADVKFFMSSCIHSPCSSGGTRVKCPLRAAMHRTKRNDLIQFDYLELGQSSTEDKYVLLVGDDHSVYFWPFSFAKINAKYSAHAILDWCAAFGTPYGLMLDGPTHFQNETVRLVTKGLRTPQNFFLCPPAHGAMVQ